MDAQKMLGAALGFITWTPITCLNAPLITQRKLRYSKSLPEIIMATPNKPPLFTSFAPQIGTVYEHTEQAAKDLKVGLWRDANPTPPWEWRIKVKAKN